MAQYINKDALIAEIKRYKNKADERLKIKGRSLAEECKDSALQNLCGNLLHFIDTQKVKEVDLEKVFNDEYSKFSNDTDAMDYTFPIDLADYRDFAKHFFELGLKAQKEQIMKDAIKATVHPEDHELWCDLSQTNLQDGQEVKVIVIKED